MNPQKNFFSIKDVNLLWLDLKEGNRDGLEGLYRVFSEDLFRFGCSKGYEIDFVQDCIQEVFIDLWKYHRSLQKADNVKVYLFRSLSHKMLRQSKLEKRFTTEEFESSHEKNFFIESIETQLINQQTDEKLKKRLADSIESLPERQKQVIVSLFFEKLSYEDISNIMGINLRSVYTLAWKAINSLKKAVLLIAVLFNFT